MPSANVIQLRQMLSERFPGVRMRLDEQPAMERFWPTGIASLDGPLRGGLPQGALTEIIAPGPSAGSATVLHRLLQHAAVEKRTIAMIDGNDSLDVTSIDPAVLARLLWVRCRSADEALKAADLVLRDGNLPLVLLDLKTNPESQLRKIPATTWYRFQRLIEGTATVTIAFTSRPMVTPAAVKVALRSRLSLAMLEAEEIINHLEFEITDARQSEWIVQNTA